MTVLNFRYSCSGAAGASPMNIRKATTSVAMNKKGLYLLVSFHDGRGIMVHAHESVDGKDAPR